MRAIASMGLLVALLTVGASTSARPVLSIPSGVPSSAEQMKELLRGNDPKNSIPPYLEEAQCGGWDKDLSVAPYIAVVEGLPGRVHNWWEDIPSGMGVRTDVDGDDNKDNDFFFPNETQGYSTACEEGIDQTQRMIWSPVFPPRVDINGTEFIEYQANWHTFAYPYVGDPTCRWRMEGGAWPPTPLVPDAALLPWDKDSVETENADSCFEFCQYANAFLYQNCADLQPRRITVFDHWEQDADGNWFEATRDEDIFVCNREALFYICTDEEINEENFHAACQVADPPLEEWANARKCEGQRCRCPNNPENGDPDACLHPPGGGQYRSYYRLYTDASFTRAAMPGDKVPNGDRAAENFQTTCFGLYDEFDPKKRQTGVNDRRCVINIDVENMRETQQGKGEYKETDVDDKDPTNTGNQRPGGLNDENGAFDVEEDTWYKKLGGAFSFINEKLFKGQYDSDLGNVFLAFDELDDGTLTATPQINEQHLFAESNLMRAFDDTGHPRAYTRWWQEQQTRMAALMRAPVLRIVLPSAWFMGLDPNDPFLTSVSGTEDPTERPDRSDRIELQVEADEDVLGTALAYIERSILLHVEEEPIPVIVPMGSPAEFRARAADWCTWYKNKNIVKTCDDVPEDIKKIMERLEEYAERIDDYRELRAETSETAGAILDLQHRLLEPIAQWFKDHEEQLRQIVQGRQRVEQELVPLWREIQGEIATMTDRSNLPWCMNQRFTSPIYSLLDPWLQSRYRQAKPNEVETSELNLPRLPLVQRPEDVIIDFSAIAAMSGTLKMPVLKPIQIRIDIPVPPKTEKLAELPPVGDIRAAMEDVLGQLPEVRNELQEPPSMEPPEPLSNETLNSARDSLFFAGRIVSEMNEQYADFWKSIGPLKPGEEQFERQYEFKEGMKCYDFNRLPCKQVEMDLLERAQRIGSRPLIQLAEDFESVGTRRGEPTVCLPEDEACHILNAERTDPGFRWEVVGSRSNDAPIDDLKVRILRVTQPPPLGSVDPLILKPHDDDPSPLQSFPTIRLLP